MSYLIAVSAVDHPDLDDWVIEQARGEAAREGLLLGEYRGREDALPAPRPDGLCCHVFDARRQFADTV